MKKVKFISIVVCLFGVMFIASSVHADLELLGQGTSVHGTYNLIYDTDFDITWYDFSYPVPSWDNAVSWADAMSVTFGSNTYNDWRLPTALNSGGTGPCRGDNCTDSEMGHLFYTELGNEGNSDIIGNTTSCGSASTYPWCLTMTGDFQNLRVSSYWSDLEANLSNAWKFNTASGAQLDSPKHDTYSAMAVMSGRAIVPEPTSVILFLSGGATMLGRYWRKKK